MAHSKAQRKLSSAASLSGVFRHSRLQPGTVLSVPDAGWLACGAYVGGVGYWRGARAVIVLSGVATRVKARSIQRTGRVPRVGPDYSRADRARAFAGDANARGADFSRRVFFAVLTRRQASL